MSKFPFLIFGFLAAVAMQGTAKAQVAAYSGAKLAAHVDSTGTLLRQKGVKAVFHPGVGIYCVQPSSATLASKLSAIVPVLSVDFGHSPNFDVTVQWDSGDDCTSNNLPASIVIFTYRDDNGGHVLADEGFTLIVQ